MIPFSQAYSSALNANLSLKLPDKSENRLVVSCQTVDVDSDFEMTVLQVTELGNLNQVCRSAEKKEYLGFHRHSQANQRGFV